MDNLKVLMSQINFLMETEANFLETFEKQLQASSAKLSNVEKLKLICALLSDGENNSEAVDEDITAILKKVITSACSKGTGGTKGLVKSAAESANDLITDLQIWVKDEFGLDPEHDLREAMGDLSVTGEEAPGENGGADFFQRAQPPLNGMEKVATVTFPEDIPEACGELFLQVGKDGLVAWFQDYTVKTWNWRNNEERTMDFAEYNPNIYLIAKGEIISSIFYNEDFTLLGTMKGTIHLLDSTTMEKKCTVRLGEHVLSMRPLESTLIVHTNKNDHDKFWRLEVTRPALQLKKKKQFFHSTEVEGRSQFKFVLDSQYIFVYDSTRVKIYHTATATRVIDEKTDICWLKPPSNINYLNVVGLISSKKVVVAGCVDGALALWTTTELSKRQRPFKVLQSHKAAIVQAFTLNGHLISLDADGKLLMWSGHDLERPHVVEPVPRILTQDIGNVNIMDGCEDWFASGCDGDSEINVWTLPDSWLLSG